MKTEMRESSWKAEGRPGSVGRKRGSGLAAGNLIEDLGKDSKDF